MSHKKILCEASEKGKIVVNKCLDLGYKIEPLKLEQLLILIHGMMLAKYNEPFFKQEIISTEYGLVIREIERDFLEYDSGFEEKLQDYILLSDNEEKTVEYIIKRFGVYNHKLLKDVIILNLLNEISCKEGTSNIIPNQFIREVFLAYNYDNPETKQKKDNYISSSKMIDFSKEYADLVNEDFPKYQLPNPETGYVPKELNLFEIVDRTLEYGFVETYCLSEEEAKKLRLIRSYKKKYGKK